MNKRKLALLYLYAAALFAGARCREFTPEEIEAFCNLTYNECDEDCRSPCSSLSSCGEECDQEGNSIIRLNLAASNLTEIPASINLFSNLTEL